MASCPTTLVVYTEDKANFSIGCSEQLFQYGVKEISEKGDKIFISLSYSPRAVTLRKQFGNFPVRYMRAKIDQKDFKILGKVVKRYKFNLLDEEEDFANQTINTPEKRKLTIEEVFTDESSSDDDDEKSENSNVKKPKTPTAIDIQTEEQNLE